MHGDYPATKMLLQLAHDNLLPSILFRTARKQCDSDVMKIARSKGCVISTPDQDRLRKETDAVIVKYGARPEVIHEHPQYAALIYAGVGAHHAGQLLIWRLLLEELMSRGLLRMMIATGTVAAGVDFPARTVVVTAHSKRGSEGFKVLTAAEFQQMSGRAGRRGKDTVGFCLVAPSQFSDARVIAEVAKKPPEPLRSAYFAAPATMLNLLRYRNVDDLRYTVSKSLASFLDRKTAHTMRLEALHLEEQLSERRANMTQEQSKKADKRVRRQLRLAEEFEGRQMDQLERSLRGLETLGFVANGSLTEKGYWAANLCTSLVLELAEAIDAGLFSDISVLELVGLVASLAGDAHKNYLVIRDNPISRDKYLKLKSVVSRVHAAYERPALSDPIGVVPDASLTVLSWIESKEWLEFAGILRLAGVAEGDVARLVSQTADHLNQITRLSKSHPKLASAADEGRRLILKPPLSDVVITAE